MKQTLTIENSILNSNTQKLTILYARLSKDDGKSGDSDSILNQKFLLERFAKEQKMSPIVFLADDGVSGTTFNRPAFQEALELVNQGRVKNFIVKDLSRFGRDYLKVGAFTEVAFPEKGVRFIAINDNVDSESPDDNSLAPFRNLFNEWYARDCSKKIKAVKHAKGNSGIPMTANVPYGYLKGENYKETHEWLVDEAAAEVIRRIFHAYASGKSMMAIAQELKSEKVLTPAAHKLSIGIKPSKMTVVPYDWNSQIVRQVLGRREYCGHTINFKTYKKSYKAKKFFETPFEQQKIFKNTHEALIDERLFELVQEKRGTYRPRQTKGKSVGLFSGLVHCIDCGYVLHYQNFKSQRYNSYYCGGATKKLKICKSRHHIREQDLSAHVLKELQYLMGLLKNHQAELVAYLEKRQGLTEGQQLEKNRQSLKKSEYRYEEIDQVIERLYEDNLSGKVSDARYEKMMMRYESEQKTLVLHIQSLKESVIKVEKEFLGIQHFVQAAKQYMNPKRLEADMVRELIENIEIGEKEMRDGKQIQKIRITYRFLGELAITDIKHF
jgi:DNA invertase Pin-like site-specific DNA recombinase